ncbi:hypothetical protein Tco_0088587 [Tanacetum coccineum]
MELEKNKAEAEAALLKAQPSFTNVEQLNELLVKSLKTEFSNILYAHDFSNSLPTELKDLPSKFNELTEETITSLTSQVAELKSLQWELPAEFLSLPVQVASVQAKLKTLDALPGLLLNVTQALYKFAQVLNSSSSKAGDHSVPSAGQADTRPTKEEKDTNQATISHIFQRRANKNAEKDNLNKNKPQTETTPPPNPPVIRTTTTKMQSPSLQPPLKSSSQHEGEHIKEDKGKKALSLEEAETESTDSDSDDETHVTGSMVEPSMRKKLKKFDFITEDGRKAVSRITNYDVLTRKGTITLKVYREDGTSEIIPNYKASTRMDYIHTTKEELGINLDIPLSKQDPLDKLNDLANKKRKHADDIHDYFKANKRLKSSVQYKDHLLGTMLNKPVLEIFFRLHQGPGLDDHASTFSYLLLAEIDMRNMNPLKPMRLIEQLRQ